MSRGSDELEEAGLDPEEAAGVAVRESRRSPGGLTTGGGADRICQDYLHAVHPETGKDVVFVPGEALPAWAQQEQAKRMSAEHDAMSGILGGAPGPAKSGGQKSIREQVKAKDGK